MIYIRLLYKFKLLKHCLDIGQDVFQAKTTELLVTMQPVVPQWLTILFLFNIIQSYNNFTIAC